MLEIRRAHPCGMTVVANEYACAIVKHSKMFRHKHKSSKSPQKRNSFAFEICSFIISFKQSATVIFFFRFANALVYYGVYMSTPTVGASMHLNFFLTSVIELPAIPAGIWIYNRSVNMK